ncbi:MAG: TIR domain-containing protein, partial [Cyanobacteria bacterium P01_E01_bin.34]
MGNDAEFDVFLCHNSEDKDAVIEIAEQLEECGLRPWLDEWELRPGLSWQLALEQQIEQIATAAVFVGDSGFGPWQQQEIYAFLNEFVSRGCPVIPVILESAPKRPELPIFLKNNTWVDFRRQRPDPIERLIWGVTGKKPSRRLEQISRDLSLHQKTQPKEIQEETVSTETSNLVQSEVDLVSALGINYEELRDFLASKKWKEANEETLHVMLTMANREMQGWLNLESIN